MGAKVSATFVIPCLNEEATLGALLDEARREFAKDEHATWEILVADNGSRDRSAEIARAHGARVVAIPERGYGAAVHGGLLATTTEFAVYGDADGTYSPRDACRLVAALTEENADLVLGSRRKGRLAEGAMPPLHRYLGTPALTLVLRTLHGIPVSDCNSGLRAVRLSAYRTWTPMDPGMEYASSMLIRAAAAGARITERPADLRAAPPGRRPHLRSWRDGMRHLLVMLAYCPQFFWRLGLGAVGISFLITLACLVGDLHLGFWSFGPHTLAMSIVLGATGSFLVNLALLLYARRPLAMPPSVERVLALEESWLWWSLVALGGSLSVAVAGLVFQWAAADFGGLAEVNFALGIVYLAVVGLSLLFGLFQVHLMKR